VLAKFAELDNRILEAGWFRVVVAAIVGQAAGVVILRINELDVPSVRDARLGSAAASWKLG
jgi:hypothetical protein